MVSSERSRSDNSQPSLLVRDGMSRIEAGMLLDWLEAHGLCPSQLEKAKDGLTVADYSRVSSALR